MHYNQSCAGRGYAGNRNAATGQEYGRWAKPHLIRSTQRAAVNVYKTENSYEMLVFAPGRIKEHFKVDVQGTELRVSYTPPEGFPRPNWVLREYSRGGFTRSFQLSDAVNTEAIAAKYEDGVLYVSLPLVEGRDVAKKEVVIN